jgi:ABC-type phosphate transport system auxiliary subunit
MIRSLKPNLTIRIIRLKKGVIEMVDAKLLEELNEEIGRLAKEYARLQNKPKPFETKDEKEAREIQFEYDKNAKWKEFESLGTNFEKKRDFVLKLRKEIEVLKLRERRDELEKRLKEKEKTITEIELLELQALNNILDRSS